MSTPPDDDILDLLTAYALGALEPDEIARVGALLADRPELRDTLAELRATADRLPYGLPDATPPADLRQRVLDRAGGRAPAQPQSASARSRGRARGWLGGLGALAAVALIAAAAGWFQLLGARARIAQLEGQVVAAQSQLDQTQAQVATARAQLDQLERQIASARQILASLQGQGGSGAVLQISDNQTLFAARLPQLQPGRVYQLWRIQGSNPPASAGLFTVNQQGYGQIVLPAEQRPSPGETVAVTDEPAGGSPGPTTQPLIAGTSASA